MLIEDVKYYDLKNIELKTIIKYAKPRGKTILDLGAGTGRLSFPLAEYAKQVIALDSNKQLKEHFERHKNKKIIFINETAEKYLKNGKKFDIILLAWPTFSFKFIDLIKNVMHKDSLFIFITCDNKSDWETIVDKIEVFDKSHFSKDISNKIKILEILPKKFKLLMNKRINTEYLYPNEKVAFRILKNDMKLWFNIKVDKESEERLKEIIKNHKKGEKVKFGERIYFYVLKLKNPYEKLR